MQWFTWVCKQEDVDPIETFRSIAFSRSTERVIRRADRLGFAHRKDVRANFRGKLKGESSLCAAHASRDPLTAPELDPEFLLQAPSTTWIGSPPA
jgi:hypothetical protein